MIAYDELCAQLAKWRSRNGMSNGASAAPRMRENTGERPAQYVPPTYAPPSAPPIAYAAQPSAPPPMFAPQPSAPPPPSQFTPPEGYAAAAGFAAAAAYEPADLPPPEDEIPSMFDDPAPGDMTEIRGTAAPPPAREDQTGEIDIDSIDVVDEEEAT